MDEEIFWITGEYGYEEKNDDNEEEEDIEF